MTSSYAPRKRSATSSVPSHETDTITIPLELDLKELPSTWYSLTPQQQSDLWDWCPPCRPIVNALYWMRHHTKTRDEQDSQHPHKPFPDYPYLDVIHKMWEKEPFLFIEKSRTMLISWWSAAETVHYVMTHQPAKAIFWAQDQDRAVTLLDYAWVLYEQQDDFLKGIYPLTRPRIRQSFDKMEFAGGGSLLALPGKDPSKIRGEHPSIVIMDECCFIENGGEAFDVAISSRVPRVLCVSSAAPSWFRRITKPATPESLEPYL
jgi:hypothetical protein